MKIETWEEMEYSDKWSEYGDMAREFAQLHVKAALEAAADNSIKMSSSKNTILNSYGPENIK